MKTKDRYLLLPAAMLALAAVPAPLALAAAPFSAPRTQAAPALSSASAERAALELLLYFGDKRAAIACIGTKGLN